MRRPRPARARQFHAAGRAAGRDLGARLSGCRAAHDDRGRSGAHRPRARRARSRRRRRRRSRPVLRRPHQPRAGAARRIYEATSHDHSDARRGRCPRMHPLDRAPHCATRIRRRRCGQLRDFQRARAATCCSSSPRTRPLQGDARPRRDRPRDRTRVRRPLRGRHPVARGGARKFAVRYGFRRWPAIVLLRDGRYVGAVDGLREWGEYVAEVARLLDAPSARAPSIGIAVTASRRERRAAAPDECNESISRRAQ